MSDTETNWDTEETMRWVDNEPTLYEGSRFALDADDLERTVREIAPELEYFDVDLGAVDWNAVYATCVEED